MPTARWVMRTVVIGLLGSALILSCQTTSSNVQIGLAGPMIKGAEYVGMETCEACHPDQAKRFKLTSHFETSVKEGENSKGEACESCHGAGSLHADSGGDPSKIVRYSADRCFVCHVDIRGKFQLQYHHPVPEKWMKCTDCHNPHSEDVKSWSAVSVLRPGEICFRCHKEFKGPFVFAHDPLRDGCQVCHNPHGSVFKKMLIADGVTLCIRCHWEPATNTVDANFAHMPHGGFAIGRGSECVDHHTAVHGSNIERHFFR
ncbi:hypothetical protein HZA56_01955 [Candidatus Poribacteria bacterium]|nr:hypothetical protein [Candidatus Poribacteria bacterium]